MDEGLIRLAMEVNWRNLALGHDVFDVEGATFVRNIELPGIYDANFVFGITASEPIQIERLLLRADQEYRHAKRVTFRVDPFTPPPFEARLAVEGYERRDAIVLLRDAPRRFRTRPSDIRRIADETGWQLYADLKRVDWHDHVAGTSSDAADDVAIADGFVSASRLKCPPVEYVLAYENGQPVGYCSVWEGLEGIGQVEDLFVHPDHRRCGIATSLLHHCVVTARQRGADPVLIVVDAMNTAKDLYSALGWRPIAVCREYGRLRR